MIPTGGIRIGKFRGIEIYLHWSWFIIFFLLLWVVMQFFQLNLQSPPVRYIPMAIITTFFFFLSVLLHEMSHSVVANRNGVPIRRITLFVFGGVAQMSKDVTTPSVEFKMAIAGPLTSYALSITFGLAAYVAGIRRAGTISFGFLLLAAVNFGLGTFNLIPGFPLDGGRVLRSFLWRRSGNLEKSTRTASRLGQGLASLLVISGITMILLDFVVPQYDLLLSGFWFILIGLFLFQAAVNSYRQVRIRTSLSHLKVGDLVRPGVPAVEASTTLEEVYRLHLQNNPSSTVPVLQRGKLWGSIKLSDLKPFDPSAWSDTPAAHAAKATAREDAADADQPLFEAFTLMERSGRDFLWVIDDGRLIGVVFREDARRLARESGGGNRP
ncbi:MAG: hypothetical protein A2Y75_08925 [Candidatus Solincola sediminis]|uniref:Zinc metalloprotease n=1 Tax=Candidatus Solincola sediminis TaxID=1797199 RepID=A0A1F2WF28_9ACTN|nr:MAG: hypothetical protein A2Y75_08925 [Candidatus Solincola sediminis]